jgi:hypothetical protein
MRKLSPERRKVAGLASSLVCLSGVGPLLLKGHPRMEWVWLAVYVALMIWVIVRMVRLRRHEGCE